MSKFLGAFGFATRILDWRHSLKLIFAKKKHTNTFYPNYKIKKYSSLNQGSWILISSNLSCSSFSARLPPPNPMLPILAEVV